MANWKHRINIKQYLTDKENLTEEQYSTIARNIASGITPLVRFLEKSEENYWLVNDLEIIRDNLLCSSTESDINDCLEMLYDVGDANSIWIG